MGTCLNGARPDQRFLHYLELREMFFLAGIYFVPVQMIRDHVSVDGRWWTAIALRDVKLVAVHRLLVA